MSIVVRSEITKYINSFDKTFIISPTGEIDDTIDIDWVEKWWKNNHIFISFLTAVDTSKYDGISLHSIKNQTKRNKIIHEMYALAQTTCEILKKSNK